MQIQKKIALVTGGSRGLGKNMALSISRKGIDVIITYNSKRQEAEAVEHEIKSSGGNAAALQLNTGEIKSFDPFVQQLSDLLRKEWDRAHIDFLINNAGIDWSAPIATTTEEQFDALLNIHFKGVYFLTQKMLTRLNDGGGIVNLSTGLARFALPGYSAYASMKGAIEIFTRYLAKELGQRRIRANVVAPGAIETDFTRAAFESHPEAKKFIASQTALGRVGVPDDIGGIVAFLCSDEARWINAQRIEASGGMLL